jgi:hypothetical protein
MKSMYTARKCREIVVKAGRQGMMLVSGRPSAFIRRIHRA